MQYRKMKKSGVDVSVLGLGCMRFPTLDGNKDGLNVDEGQAINMVRTAIDNGVNYIDTAYVYHGGRSESIVGKALKKGYRNKTYLATKSPVFMMKKKEDFDRFLDEQLKRLGTDHIDFYLLHALNEARWKHLIEPLELLHQAEQAKNAGKIVHLGFSFHDKLEAFYPMVDAHNWDFCQIQLNYMDEEEQAGLKGLRYIADKGLDVIIMEPLKGGRLAGLTPGALAEMEKSGMDRTPVQLALDYLWDKPDIHCLLSGASSMEQLMQNIAYANKAQANSLTETDIAVIAKVRQALEAANNVSCTGCGYCMPCPHGVDIPKNFTIYNDVPRYETPHLAKGDFHFMKAQDARKIAGNCKDCGQCLDKCPQSLPIAELLKKAQAVFDTL